MGAVVALVVLAAVLAAYLTSLAGRLDRAMVRVEAARTSLEAQLLRRAAAARALAARLPPDEGLALEEAAGAALDADAPERESAESALTRALRPALASAPAAAGWPPVGDEETTRLLAEADSRAVRVQLARQFHNDAVHACLALRRRRVVRWLHLYGRARRPTYFEIDDAAR